MPELPIALTAQLGLTDALLVLDRRGSMIWDVRTAEGRHALKLGYPIAETEHWPGQPWTAMAPAREAAVLTHLGRPALSGEWEQGTWNMQPWHEGPDLYRLWEHTRSDSRVPSVPVALECARALHDLHAQGWAHGDVQPAHFIVAPDSTRLIDLALAHGKPVPEHVDFPFRGCLVHYEAPELSHQVLETGQAVPSQAGDVYALGASLMISATGRRAVIYPDDASRPAQRAAIVEGNRRAVNIKGPLGPLVEQMLRPDPERRPGIERIVSTLERLT